jgi:hypothetical protein
MRLRFQIEPCIDEVLKVRHAVITNGEPYAASTSGTHRTYWLSVPRRASIAETVGNIIADIRSKDDPLDMLQLLGHGDFGVMTIGEEWNVTSIAPIHLLKPYFVDMAMGIQLLGCGVASSTSIVSGKRVVLGSFSVSGAGYQMMRTMARLTGVCVEAGIHVQRQDPFYDIEGSAIRVYPDGTWENFIGGSNE